jgi:predicted transcriptional regulator
MTGNVVDPIERYRRIQELARQIWEAEGRPDGQALRHWGMAERLVQAEISAAEVEAGAGGPPPQQEVANGQP